MSDPANRHPARLARERKGPIAQRELLVLMRAIIDAASAKGASHTRDEARRTIRRLMAETNWNTPFIKELLGARRCRYLSSLGYIIEPRYLAASPEDIARVIAHAEGRRG